MNLDRLEKKLIGHVECGSARLILADAYKVIYNSGVFDHLRKETKEGDMYIEKTLDDECVEFDHEDSRPGLAIDICVQDTMSLEDTRFPVYGYFDEAMTIPSFVVVDTRDSELRDS